MKFSLFFLVVLMIVVQNEVMGKPGPNPAPDNDVHFHVYMPGFGRSFPLKGKGRVISIDSWTSLLSGRSLSENLNQVSAVNRGCLIEGFILPHLDQS